MPGETPLHIDTPSEAARAPSFDDVLKTFARIGVLSFGGPSAQIALMHRIIVDEKKWLDEPRYLSALSFCMLLPGPEAMQLATYVGWRLLGLAGGIAAGLLFVLPGALIVLALSMVYAAFGNVPLIEALFFGVKAAVLVIVVEALLRIARRALTLREHWIIAGLSFVAIFFFAAPFPLIVLAAALFGFFHVSSRVAAAGASFAMPLIATSRTLRTIGLWLLIWFVPLGAIAAVFGRDHVLSQLGVFFSKLAVVTFGGAYAVLAYMGQDVVAHYGWLDAGAMMDGLGLAETTPGPLILVTEFVGYLAAHRNGGGPPTLMGLLGAFVALWATFAPCFLWILAGAPYIEWITHQPRLRGALHAITAAVVGVILNLAIWFALHVFFTEVALVEAGPLKLWTPTLASLDWRVVALSAIAAFLIFKRRWDIPAVLCVTAALALAIRLSGI
ncbi:chromate efflux transporter [Hyphomicrobium sp.]|uniref:chromate efflux transporter n=1 Tax=Hyphomicrobium sp. TaxID=82 RepID=UPI0025BFF63D|nr:chromate efflux transporter [Hyphomicrobium sp.]MCC7251299.1 chromate efflux transporter [Hyphomicrobium sp.]